LRAGRINHPNPGHWPSRCLVELANECHVTWPMWASRHGGFPSKTGPAGASAEIDVGRLFFGDPGAPGLEFWGATRTYLQSHARSSPVPLATNSQSAHRLQRIHSQRSANAPDRGFPAPKPPSSASAPRPAGDFLPCSALRVSVAGNCPPIDAISVSASPNSSTALARLASAPLPAKHAPSLRNHHPQNATLHFPFRLAPSSFSRTIPMLSSARNQAPSFPIRESSRHISRFSCSILNIPSLIFPTCPFTSLTIDITLPTPITSTSGSSPVTHVR
jgi:hypothetical protein